MKIAKSLSDQEDCIPLPDNFFGLSAHLSRVGWSGLPQRSLACPCRPSDLRVCPHPLRVGIQFAAEKPSLRTHSFSTLEPPVLYELLLSSSPTAPITCCLILLPLPSCYHIRTPILL